VRKGYDTPEKLFFASNEKSILSRVEMCTKRSRSNETWAMDFVHDQLATGRKLRVLTIVDTFSRFSPALEPRSTFRGADVVEVLERVGRQVGFPATIRADQGTEFVSRDLELWAYQRSVTLDFSRPGKPTDTAFIEAFNGRFRAECLNAHWFLSLADAQKKLEDWRKYPAIQSSVSEQSGTDSPYERGQFGEQVTSPASRVQILA
jgi:transposase InsO family protein